ncbi:HalOD1 output domain-containing protein [Halobiforma nitratireducens]|uniref:Halobacterial output domain-containing protein n=1 Tax=Halobiforma nitratireducens JCM 10879 TaxID=1227454 RepID=M0LYY4_9EURY|nr:HalOD1 output domain-containing protein [Halobiforma nitratireducens]EMA37335.1 hypothetical protein C446_10780 [Halobiforma nitratireducens JCM 10879]
MAPDDGAGNAGNDLSPDDLLVDTHRRDSEPTVHAVARAIATAQEVPVAELDPLYEHVPVDALEALLEGADERELPVEIRFPLESHVIVVSAGDSVSVLAYDKT